MPWVEDRGEGGGGGGGREELIARVRARGREAGWIDGRMGFARERRVGWCSRERGGGFAAVGWDGPMDGWMFARSSIQATSDSTNQN